MKIQQIQELTDATVACGNDKLGHEVQCAFASDLMSDVLTLCCDEMILITGLWQFANDPYSRNGRCRLYPFRPW